MEKSGQRLSGVRLDSGNLIENSKKSVKMLDGKGLHYVTILQR